MGNLFKSVLSALFVLAFCNLYAQNLPIAVTLAEGITSENNPLDTGNECTGGPGREIHDDGTFENGYGWSNGVTDGRWVIKFRPVQYPWQYNKFCFAITRTSSGTPSFGLRIAAYDSMGSGGIPGNQIWLSDSMVISGIPLFPLFGWYSFNLTAFPLVTAGAIYIGVKYNAMPAGQTFKYIMADQSALTLLWPGYGWSNAGPWTPIQNYFGGYRCLAMRTDGSEPLGIEQTGNGIPSSYYLAQNYPNPFNPATTIEFSLPEGEFVEITIFDVTGKEVESIVRDRFQAGRYKFTFDATNLVSGVYFYKISAGTFTDVKKMLLIK